MSEKSTTGEPKGTADRSGPYVRFILLGRPRTGSTMLVQALNSNPGVICWSEIFNKRREFSTRDVGMPTHLDRGAEALRNRDYDAFLRDRIFCRHEEERRAVGFKIFYHHFSHFDGLEARLTEDTELRVLHLRRRNALRTLVSGKINQETGIAVLPSYKSVITFAKLMAAARQPLKAASWLRRRLRLARRAGQTRVRISAEELVPFARRMDSLAARFDDAFGRHPRLTIFYEDMDRNREEAFDRVQSFIGVEKQPLTVTLRKQNPQPLRDLIENYDELYEELQSTPYVDWLE